MKKLFAMIMIVLSLAGCDNPKPEITFGNIMYCSGSIPLADGSKKDIVLSSEQYLTIETPPYAVISRSPDYHERLTIYVKSDGNGVFKGQLLRVYNDQSIQYNIPLRCIKKA